MVRINTKKIIGVLFSLALGNFGAHHFYLKNYKLGTAYFLFSFTGIPAVLGIIEAFYMPSRVGNNETLTIGKSIIIFSILSFLFSVGVYFEYKYKSERNTKDSSIGQSKKLQDLKTSMNNFNNTEGSTQVLENIFASPEKAYDSELIHPSLKETLSRERFEKIITDTLEDGKLKVQLGDKKLPGGFSRYKKVFSKDKVFVFYLNSNPENRVHLELWKLENSEWKLTRIKFKDEKYNWNE